MESKTVAHSSFTVTLCKHAAPHPSHRHAHPVDNALLLTPVGQLPSPRLSFRKDLNWAKQFADAAFSRQSAYHAVLMSTWESTCGSREEHHFVLCTLIVEAFRFRANKGAPLCKEFVLGLLQDVTEGMYPQQPLSTHERRGQPKGNTRGDDYVDLLDRIAALSLFRDHQEY